MYWYSRSTCGNKLNSDILSITTSHFQSITDFLLPPPNIDSQEAHAPQL